MAFNSSNPVYRHIEGQYAAEGGSQTQTTSFSETTYKSATWKGVILKTTLLLVIAIVSGLVSIFLPVEVVMGFLVAGGIASFIFVMIATRNAKRARLFSILYAITQGIVYGSLTYLIELAAPGVGIMAMVGTAAVVLTMAGLYSIGAVRTTPFLLKFVMISLVSILITSIVMLIISFVNAAFYAQLADNISLGIFVSGVLIILGAIMLILDFDRVKLLVENKAPVAAEWQAALGILVTTVWIYVNMLKFIMYIAARSNRK